MMIMAECMKRYDATYTAGTYAGSLTLAASVVSAMHYHTFSNLGPESIILYPLGLVTLMVGVGLLMQENDNTNVRTDKEELVITPQTSYEGNGSADITAGAHIPATMKVCTAPDRAAYLRLRAVQLV